MEKECDFIQQHTGKTLLNMFFPMMIGAMLYFAYNIVDSLWIGNLMGDTALAALTTVSPIVTLMTAFGTGITAGMGILISEQLSLKDKNGEEKIISYTLLITIIASIVMVLSLELFLDPILYLLNVQIETYEMAKAYIAVCLLGMIPSYILFHITTALRCYGDTVAQMVILIVSSAANMVLDPLLIKAIGFDGAAWATVISQVLSLVILSIYCKKKQYFKLRFTHFGAGSLKSVVKLSVPTVFQQCTPLIGSAVLTACAGNFGIAALAAYGIIVKLNVLICIPSGSLKIILTPIVSYCVGGGRKDRAADYTKLSIKYCAIIVGISGILLIIFAKSVASAFGCDPQTAVLVQHGLVILIGGCMLEAITDCLVGHINGLGYPDKGMIVIILNCIVVRIPLAIILASTVLGLNGIWIAWAISFIISFVFAVFLFRRLNVKQRF